MNMIQHLKTKWKNYRRLQRRGRAAQREMRALLAEDFSFDRFVELSDIKCAALQARTAHRTALIVSVMLLTLVLLCCSHILKVNPELRNAIFPHTSAEEQEEYVVYATIYLNNHPSQVVCLTDETDRRSFLLMTDDNEEILIHVREQSIGILYIRCSDQQCVERGMVSYSSIPIICLEQKLAITFRRCPA